MIARQHRPTLKIMPSINKTPVNGPAGPMPGLAAVLLLMSLFAARSAAAGETFDLRPAPAAGRIQRIETILQVGGEALMPSGAAKPTLPLSVIANISYDETLLGETTSEVLRSLRWYDEANVAIKVASGGQKPALRDDRRLIVAEQALTAPAAATAATAVEGSTSSAEMPVLTGVTLFSPSGPLTRDELDLIDVPGNSLICDELLPSEPVEVGATWSHKEQTLASLLGLDAASSVSVTSTLTEVSDDLAKMVLEGKLRGAIGGVATEIELKAKYNFDLNTKRINWLALLIKEKRAIGHVGPGLDVVAKLIMKVTPIAQSVHFTPEMIAQAAQPAEGMTLLEYRSAKGNFQFDYDRRWFVTSEETNVAVLRLLDRGELVAQCNISPLASVEKPTSLEDFQKQVRTSLDKSFGQFLQANEERTEQGYHVIRLVASGHAANLPIHWIYYLVTSPSGERATMAFTFESELGERFGAADRELIGTLRFVEPVTTASRPAIQPVGPASQKPTR